MRWGRSVGAADAGQGPLGRLISIGFGHWGQGLLHQGAVALLTVWGFVADFGGGDDDAAHVVLPLRVRLTPRWLLGTGGTYEPPSYQPLTR